MNREGCSLDHRGWMEVKAFCPMTRLALPSKTLAFRPYRDPDISLHLVAREKLRKISAGSQVGSHSRWMTLDGRGQRWRRQQSARGRMHSCGRPRIPLGHLRIRRLGVRVAPGAQGKSPGTCRSAADERAFRIDQSPRSFTDGNRSVTRFSGPGLIPAQENAPTLTGRSPVIT